ncbi:hypothetical protein BVY02_00835 [bacterium J17]|nr:hypothetical protein BVY02_00835 [bacterium J17]
MTDDTTIKSPAQLEQLFNTPEVKTKASSETQATKSETINQDEFLTLLVHQLQNQDPLDPMKAEEFAVNLAQFSQLEQLVSINGKLDGAGGPAADSGNTISSMAGFLGHQVVLKNQQAEIRGGNGPDILVDLPSGVQSARIDFIDENGGTAGSHFVDSVQAGQQSIPLNGISVPSGVYDVRAVAVGASGEFVTSDAKITGTVEGFILEPEPALLVGGQEVTLEEVEAVYQAKG